jgi:hypothetical protein
MKSFLEIFIVTLATGDAIQYAKKRLDIQDMEFEFAGKIK